MRKIFATLKSVVAAALVVSMTLAVSCSYDDTAVKNDIKNLKGDLAKLTERVVALEDAAKAQAPTLEELLGNKLVIVEVTTNENGEKVLKLSNGESITIFNAVECDHECTPCDCDTLQYRVVEGVLEVSADGENWVAVNGVAANQVVVDVVINEDGSATIKLATGEEFTVGVAELIEFEATRTQVYVKAGETKEIAFAINDAVEDINIMNQPLGWKASVNAATRAAGGQDFVLNVTAPSKELLASGIAEKEGEVLVHFNTAAGACKVMNVTVNLAELSIAVDKAGNVTITSSVLDYYEGYDNLTWEPYEYENFITWYIGVLPIQSFNGTITEDVMSDSVLGTYGWMFGVDEMPYVEGEYELQVVETSLQWMFEEINYETMSTTESYVVYLVPFADGGRTPVFEDAVYAPFKQLNVAVEEVEAYYNDVLLNVTFAGAEKYHITAVAESDLEWYDGAIENYIQENIMMYFAYDYIQFANTIEEDFFGKEISLRGLIDYGTEPWYSVLPNETYYLVVLPIEDSSVAYTDYVLEDFRYYEFATTDIVEAAEPIAHTATFVDEESSALGISVQVSYDADVVDYAYYKWYAQEQFDITKEDLLKGNEVNLDYPAYESCSAPGEQKVLVVLLVNKNGEYTIAQHTFHSKEVVYSDAEISFESVTFEDGYINVTIAGAENVDFFRYYVNTVDVANTSEEFLAPLAYKTISGGKTAYTNPFSQAYASDWSRYSEGKTYFIALVAVFKDGTVSQTITGEFEYVAVPVEVVSLTATLGGTTTGDQNFYSLAYNLSNGDVVAADFRTNGNNYLTVGSYTDSYGSWTAGEAEGHIGYVYKNNEAVGFLSASVSYADGAYTVNLSIYDYNKGAAEDYTYTGAIEGLVEPVIPEEPEQPEGGEGDVINVTILNHTVGYDQPGEKEVQFWYSATNAHVIDFKGFDNCNPGQPLAAGTYSSAAFTIDASYSIFDYGTTNGPMTDIEVVVTDNGDGTYTFDAKFSHNGQKYAFLYTGSYPA